MRWILMSLVWHGMRGHRYNDQPPYDLIFLVSFIALLFIVVIGVLGR